MARQRQRDLADLAAVAVVIEVPKPSREQGRVIVRAIAAAAITLGLDDDAVDILADLGARQVRRAIELAFAYAVCARQKTVSADDVSRALALAGGARRRTIGFRAGMAP